MNKDINTSQEIIDFYGNRLIKAFGDLVLCRNYNKKYKYAIDGYSVLLHQRKVCGLFQYDDYELANERFETLKWAMQVNLIMNNSYGGKNE